MSAQPGPYGQGQQYLPNPGSFVQNPAGVLTIEFLLFLLDCSFSGGHKNDLFLMS